MSTQPAAPDERRTRRLVEWALVAVVVALVLLMLSRLLGGPAEQRDGAIGGPTGASPTPSSTPTPGPSPSEDPSTPAPTPSGVASTQGSGASGGSVSPGGKPFTMTASVSGGALRPGAARTLVVAVANPNDVAIELDRVEVTVGDPSAAGCLASWVRVGAFSSDTDPRTVVSGGGTATIRLSIELVNLATTNQDACKGASFPLALAGSAREVPA